MIPQKQMLGLIMSSHLIFLIRAVCHSRIRFFAVISKSGEADGEIMIPEEKMA